MRESKVCVRVPAMGLQTRVPRLLPCEMSRQARLLVCVLRVYWRLDEESAPADREADAPTSLDIWYRVSS